MESEGGLKPPAYGLKTTSNQLQEGVNLASREIGGRKIPTCTQARWLAAIATAVLRGSGGATSAVYPRKARGVINTLLKKHVQDLFLPEEAWDPMRQKSTSCNAYASTAKQVALSLIRRVESSPKAALQTGLKATSNRHQTRLEAVQTSFQAASKQDQTSLIAEFIQLSSALYQL